MICRKRNGLSGLGSHKLAFIKEYRKSPVGRTSGFFLKAVKNQGKFKKKRKKDISFKPSSCKEYQSSKRTLLLETEPGGHVLAGATTKSTRVVRTDNQDELRGLWK